MLCVKAYHARKNLSHFSSLFVYPIDFNFFNPANIQAIEEETDFKSRKDRIKNSVSYLYTETMVQILNKFLVWQSASMKLICRQLNYFVKQILIIIRRKTMFNFLKNYRAFKKYLYSPKGISILKALVIMSLSMLASQVFATDLLKGTETALLDTLQNTGKKYIYLAEGITAIASYITTKNVLVLVGVVVVAIFLNIVISLAK
jgi:hypothetical protein